ncbi:hypothetical protein [Rouxiella sp. Mn2063]|uniref:hypothetical protein n=1 Tax=Rouxiella sp. Mn2063 TaxID=3395262 RepID=UPI003BBFD73D
MTVKRWSVGVDGPDENGNLVAYADYLSLAAENSSLRLTIDNIVNALGWGDGPVSQQVIELVTGLVAENVASNGRLQELIQIINNADNSYCMCGDVMESHVVGGCGSPTGMFDYHYGVWLESENKTPITDAAIAKISAKSIEKAADDLAGENNIGGHEVDAMYKYAANLRAGGKAS